MKKSSFITFLFFVLLLAALALFIIGFSIENGALIISGVICFCTACLIISIAVIFLKDDEDDKVWFTISCYCL